VDDGKGAEGDLGHDLDLRVIDLEPLKIGQREVGYQVVEPYGRQVLALEIDLARRLSPSPPNHDSIRSDNAVCAGAVVRVRVRGYACVLHARL
jgi:hypothetical protein